MGKASRDKGALFEREVVNALKEHHLNAKRVPLSGAAEGFKGDVLVDVHWQDKPLKLECKRRANGFGLIYDNLGDNDAVVVRADRKPAVVCMSLEMFARLCQ